MPLKELPPEELKTMNLNLVKSLDAIDSQNEKGGRGQLEVELTYKPFKEEDMPTESNDFGALMEKAPEGTPAGGGLLVIVVHEAQDLEGKNHNNPFVRILFKGEERKTKVDSIPFLFNSTYIDS